MYYIVTKKSSILRALEKQLTRTVSCSQLPDVYKYMVLLSLDLRGLRNQP